MKRDAGYSRTRAPEIYIHKLLNSVLWKLPGFLIYLHFAKENVFRVILVFNIGVLWDEKIAATRACTRSGTTD